MQPVTKIMSNGQVFSGLWEEYINQIFRVIGGRDMNHVVEAMVAWSICLDLDFGADRESSSS